MITSKENELIYIELEVTSKCFFKCEYCCAESPLRNEKYSDDEKIVIFEKIIDNIAKMPYKFGIRIMGGEPMLFKYLQRLINKINQTKNIVKVMLFSNCYLNKIPNGNFEITTSIHIQYLNKFEKVLENLKKFKNNVIVNIILPNFNQYQNIDKLITIINEINKRGYFSHIQLLYKNSDTLKNFELWSNFFSKYNLKEYFNLSCYYNNNIKQFFNAKKLICEPNCFQINSELILSCDCNHINITKNLKENFDLSDIKPIKFICNNISCYYDNCAYYKMHIIK